MAKLAIPDSPKLYTTRYDNLRGLDVSSPPTEISTYHAADMLNVVPDKDNGIPTKRIGWRVAHTFDDPVVAVYHDVDNNFDLIATSKELWKYNCVAKEFVTPAIFTSLTEASGVAIIPFLGNIYVAGWGDLKVLSAPYFNTLSSQPEYIPNTVISRKQDGTGGTALEGVNALSDKRMISFLSDADPETAPSNDKYYVYPQTDWGNHSFTIESVEVFDKTDSVWKAATYTPINETINSNTVLVGFQLSVAHAQVVLGQDDVRVTITETTDHTIKTAIGNTSIVTSYGLNSMDRLFFASGNKIYYTDAEKPNFIPDDNYIVVGQEVPIVGLHRYNGYLVAITEDADEFTVCMIHGLQQSIVRTVYATNGDITTESELMTYFSIKATLAGTGAVAKRSFATLVDDPLFLANTGIYGINSNQINTVTVITNRSYNINPLLREEAHKEKACACVWRGLYLLAVNGNVYVLDSHNTTRTPAGTGYECYFLNNIPASIFLSYNDNLWFGDEDGNWYRFNTDHDDDPAAWTDNSQFNDAQTHLISGDAIPAHYTLRMDYDNAPQYFKILQKKGTVIELFPYPRSGASIYAKKDNGDKMLLKEGQINTGIFSFNDVNFTNFIFGSDSSSRFVYTKKKIKKYKTLQIIIENNNESERFGVVSVTKTYTIGNFAKG